jgi:two-component system cell cycle response regulator
MSAVGSDHDAWSTTTGQPGLVDAASPGAVAVLVAQAGLHPTIAGHLERQGLRVIEVSDVAAASELLASDRVALAVVETATLADTGIVALIAQAAQQSGRETGIFALGAPDQVTVMAAFRAGAAEVCPSNVRDEELGVRLRLMLERRGERLNLLNRLDYLEWISGTDVLTTLPNRRRMSEEITRHASLATRHGFSLAVTMFDVDEFKQLNDRFGHSGGDAALREVGATLRSSMRRGDVVGRWGGDEFLAVLPHTTLADAVLLAERIRASLAEAPLLYENEWIRVTVSAGCTANPGTWDDLLTMSDLALYDAKAAGRNQVQVR